jgi:arginase
VNSSQPVVICVRTNLGLVPGVEELGAALLEAGIAAGIGAAVGPTVTAPPYTGRRDRSDEPMHVTEIAEVAIRQADVVGEVLDAGSFPVVLGGDDSILFGSLLALRRRGRYGLVFVDAHLDYWPPVEVASGQASDSDLYMSLGNGPKALADLEGQSPLVRAEDTVAIGARVAEELELLVRVEAAGVLAVPLLELRRLGPAAVAATALAKLAANGVDGVFVHLDADALDDAIMPAVDWRYPDGLSGEEYTELVSELLSSPLVVGIDVTIYNPSLDPDRTCAAYLAELLSRAWRSAQTADGAALPRFP